MCGGQPCPDSADNPDACPQGWQAWGAGNECVQEGSKPGTVGYQGPGGGAPKAPGTEDPNFDPNDPLQAQLMQMYQEHGGAFGQAQQGGQALGKGGIWWTGQSQSPKPYNAPASNTPRPIGGMTTNAAPASTAGLAASMTQTNAPSVTGIASGMMGGITPTKQPMTGIAPTAAAPVTGAITGALGRAYKDPSQWWKRQ